MIGDNINNYTILERLGEGGMGTVYLAEHVLIGHKVAVKVLRREYAENKLLVSRFLNEAKAAHAIRHQNIVQVLDAGTLPDGRPYLVMELLSGQTLGRRLEQADRLPVAEALGYAAQVASAVGAAHRRGIVHRDLKPDNIFLVDEPEVAGPRRVKLLDFGIAKLQREITGTSFRTNTGSLLGTPPYMSPEQCRGVTDEIDHRTDIYSLGIILYEMLCGAPPFVSRGYGDVLMMHMSVAPRPPREINDAVPPAIEAVILRALHKERDRRFADMDELARALGAPAPVQAEGAPGEPPAGPRTTPAPTVVLTPGSPGSSEEWARRRRSTTLSSTASQIHGARRGSRATRRLGPRRGLIVGGLAAAGLTALAIGSWRRPHPVAGGPGPSASAGAPSPPSPVPKTPMPSPPPPSPAAVAPPAEASKPKEPPAPPPVSLRRHAGPRTRSAPAPEKAAAAPEAVAAPDAGAAPATEPATAADGGAAPAVPKKRKSKAEMW